ncbi:phage holin family protein [Eubacteriales bacterium OttesenSCG-928-A19]|nr:phage holin family protein [Eubacteriales bacterium OttesenSCG-928-A19]
MKKILAILMLVSLMFTTALAVAEEAVASPPVSIDLTPLFQAVIGVLAMLITTRLIPWLKARTTERQQSTLAAVVDTLVYAAEQLYKTERITDRLAYVKRELELRGYEVDIAAIEAAVRKMQECRLEMGAPLLTEGVVHPPDGN